MPSTQSGTRYYQQSLADFSKAFWTVCTRCKLKKSENLKYLLQVYAQETTFWIQEVWFCCRLKLMVQRHLEQKIKDSHFKEINRDEDRPASGAPSKVKTKGKVKYNAKKDNSERGDCTRWITRGQCSFGDSCALTHEPNKKGKGKGRLRSPSPTGSPHRTSNGDGKGSDDGGLKGTQKLAGKSPSGKRTDYLV